jgi:hypothetical protein
MTIGSLRVGPGVPGGARFRVRAALPPAADSMESGGSAVAA